MSISHPYRTFLSLAMTAAALLYAAGASAAHYSGTVKVGISTALSGSIASLGQTGKNGLEVAIEDLNAKGGLLGKKVELVSADDQATPATGVTNVRNFVLDDGVKAVFGPVSSAVAAAEEGVAAQYHVPIFFFTSNDVDLTTKHFTKYAFQVVPNTYMEPHAVAAYMAKKGWKTYVTISPNYSFGRSTVNQFLAGMKKYHAHIKVLGQQWPKLGESDFTNYISTILSKRPEAVFSGLYGGDLITFTKQAEGFDFFKKEKDHFYALYTLGALKAMGKDAPAGVIAASRAPFYAIHTPGMKQFAKQYHDKYGQWPTAWAVMGYTAIQTWSQGVRKAHSFNADKVSAALSGATVKTIRGPIHLRACDHQGNVREYVGTLSQKVDPKYGFRTMDHIFTPNPKKIMLTCAQAKALQPH
ncbi:MAG TPA: ABC transporter substrate-binding protein [Gammaproteobacteria bacterium]|nr:ABC transporter substrate-binding protein [Gammaproteobacteria bacterium]